MSLIIAEPESSEVLITTLYLFDHTASTYDSNLQGCSGTTYRRSSRSLYSLVARNVCKGKSQIFCLSSISLSFLMTYRATSSEEQWRCRPMLG